MSRKFTIMTNKGFEEISASDFPKLKGFKYMFGVRHIRFFYLAHKLNKYIKLCSRMGLGFFPQESDLLHLQKIWEGRA